MDFKRSIDPESGAVAKILRAAEALYSSNGVESTSLRQITQEAQVNIASVNYHFGSKDSLTEAVFERLVARVTEDRLASLERILEDARSHAKPPRLEDIVSAFVHPYLGEGNDAQGLLMARFILTHRLAPNAGTKRIVETYLNPLAQAYVDGFHKALPGLQGKDMFWPYLLMVSTIVLATTEDMNGDRLSKLTDGQLTFSNRVTMRDALVNFICGGIANDGNERFIDPPA